MRFAPRYDSRILDAVRALDDRDLPIAEVARRVGRTAEILGLTRPSYVHVRRLVLAHRELEDFERARREEIRKIFVDVYTDATGARLVDAYEVAERVREAGRPKN